LVPYSEEVRRNRARLAQPFRVYLASGVTSVADVGAPFLELRGARAARASLVAPRVATGDLRDGRVFRHAELLQSLRMPTAP
jgi:hypothetical protein